MRQLSKLTVLSLNMQSWKGLLVSNFSFVSVKSRESSRAYDEFERSSCADRREPSEQSIADEKG